MMILPSDAFVTYLPDRSQRRGEEPGQDLSSGFQERGPTVTITLPFLCPSSTYRWASTISSSG
jgi:hypothetical protein